ncbi:hypothetical protein KJ781_03710 [Patescibacteria group bacterium]|nr:hypothetical protein [Patescibacteria group bacterium]MBU1448679.1 hypothetical protein [Patescibacteria group bacterium]MBU2613263.1 hypothetical protein [Patescibacteria group bacterium]
MNTRFLSLCSALALLAAACGGGTDTNEGDGGGGGNTTTTGSGNTGSGSSTTTDTTSTGSGGGGGSVCNPTLENDFCANADSCDCLPTDTTEDSWCDAYEAVSVFICPDGVDVCTPGHNTCGYDLPPGEDYVPADATCVTFVNGDGWAGNGTQSNIQSPYDPYDANDQLHIGFGSLFVGESEYYTNFTMSGKKFYWNRANASQYESGEGEIADNCTSLEVRFYGAGESTPYATYTATHVNQ